MSDATLDELRAAVRGYVKADRALLVRARAGREAVSLGADPALTLALVVWPPEELLAMLERAGREARAAA